MDNRETTWSLALTAICALAAMCVLVCVLIFASYTGPHAALKRAIDESRYVDMTFQIYDRSTNESCDRLIVTKPFDWYIWASRGELYILNVEDGTRCSCNSTPAIRVFGETFMRTCLSVSFNTLVHSYTSLLAIRVPYTINHETFTALSALNILAENGWITFNMQRRDDRHNNAVNSASLERDETLHETSLADDGRVVHNVIRASAGPSSRSVSSRVRIRRDESSTAAGSQAKHVNAAISSESTLLTYFIKHAPINGIVSTAHGESSVLRRLIPRPHGMFSPSDESTQLTRADELDARNSVLT